MIFKNIYKYKSPVSFFFMVLTFLISIGPQQVAASDPIFNADGSATFGDEADTIRTFDPSTDNGELQKFSYSHDITKFVDLESDMTGGIKADIEPGGYVQFKVHHYDGKKKNFVYGGKLNATSTEHKFDETWTVTRPHRTLGNQEYKSDEIKGLLQYSDPNGYDNKSRQKRMAQLGIVAALPSLNPFGLLIAGILLVALFTYVIIAATYPHVNDGSFSNDTFTIPSPDGQKITNALDHKKSEYARHHPESQRFQLELVAKKARVYSVKMPSDDPVKASDFPVLKTQLSVSHPCAQSGNIPAVCSTLNDLLTVDENAKANILPVPHRGYWGFDLGEGPAEDSESAMMAAVSKGLKVLEMDVTPSSDSIPISSHDYGVKRLTNFNPPNEVFFKETSSAMAAGYHVKDRNGLVTSDYILTMEQVFQFAKDYNLVIMLDVKETRDYKAISSTNRGDARCIKFCEYSEQSKRWESEIEIGKQLLKIIDEKDAWGNAIFKTFQPADNWINAGIHPAYFNKMLFMVVTGGSEITKVCDKIDDWEQKLGSNVITYEMIYKDENSTLLQPFNRKTKNWENIMHYLTVYHKKRPAIFSNEPQGPKAEATRFASWHYADYPSDRRGNHLWAVRFKYANNMIVTTDRPEIWEIVKQIRESLTENPHDELKK